MVFPAIAAIVALACAAITGIGAWRRPKPELVTWTVAFVVFAVAATAEVIGSTIGWSPTLVRIYYLGGAVLVVGILALGELYLLLPGRMPPLTPGIALLVAALAATTVWSAAIDVTKLQSEGWGAIERSPLLIALAASINAGGTLILAGGALFSAWRLRENEGSRRRAIGCLLIALGTLLVASGGTLTRFGFREYLYLAMALGITVIFSGVMLAGLGSRSRTSVNVVGRSKITDAAVRRVRLIALPTSADATARSDPGLTFISTRILPLSVDEIETTCRQWSAADSIGPDLSREQARQVWALRLKLADDVRERFDDLPLPVQAQLTELYFDVWSVPPTEAPTRRHA